MRLRLIVEDKASVDAWKQQQKPLLSTILEANPKFISKIPEKLRAKAMDYAPYVEEAADSTTAKSGSATATSASLR
jgi:cytochrome c oxidase subunit 2